MRELWERGVREAKLFKSVLVLIQENERLLGRRLRGFAEMQLSSYVLGHTH